MPLPANFDEWEHLQDAIRVYHNKAVRLYYKNQPDDDISTPKASLKHGCLIKDGDTVEMTMMRLWLFEVTVGHLQAVNPVVYGIPTLEFQRATKFKPQVRLTFTQPREDIDDDSEYNYHESQITFRLMNQTSETIARVDAERLAIAIKREMATPPFVWEKGWYKYSYQDIEKGYDFSLYVRSKAIGEQIVRKVLAIQNDTFNPNCVTYHDHDRTYPLNSGTHRVYGKLRRKYVKRPRVDVKFRYAQLHIQGMPNPINLVSVGGRLRSVIEAA
jgi:hypothetical protein